MIRSFPVSPPHTPCTLNLEHRETQTLNLEPPKPQELSRSPSQGRSPCRRPTQSLPPGFRGCASRTAPVFRVLGSDAMAPRRHAHIWSLIYVCVHIYTHIYRMYTHIYTHIRTRSLPAGFRGCASRTVPVVRVQCLVWGLGEGRDAAAPRHSYRKLQARISVAN